MPAIEMSRSTSAKSMVRILADLVQIHGEPDRYAATTARSSSRMPFRRGSPLRA
jgi:hypothetical protein